jgi:hypothetical protein
MTTIDPEAFGAAMGELVREAIAPLLKRIGELETKLSDIPQGVTAEQVEIAVKATQPPDIITPLFEQLTIRLAAAEQKLAQPAPDVEALVAKAVAAIPPAAPGKDGVGLKGDPGDKGEPGTNGEPGAKGADGVGLAGAMIDRDGCLMATLTNGEVKNLGPVVGKDGIGFESFDMEYLPESHEVAIKASAAGRTKELRFPAGGIRPGGYWRDGTKALAAQTWVHDGSMFIALKDTNEKPSTESKDWIIGARRGRDGERGVKGSDGGRPAPIKL